MGLGARVCACVYFHVTSITSDPAGRPITDAEGRDLASSAYEQEGPRGKRAKVLKQRTNKRPANGRAT